MESLNKIVSRIISKFFPRIHFCLAYYHHRHKWPNLTCPKDLSELWIKRLLDVRTLLALENKELQYNTAMKIFDEKLSVRETERLVKEILNPKVKKEKKVNLEEEAIYEGLEEKIKSIIGTKVSIHRGAKHKGKIEIEYYSQEELERIMDLFESIQ